MPPPELLHHPPTDRPPPITTPAQLAGNPAYVAQAWARIRAEEADRAAQMPLSMHELPPGIEVVTLPGGMRTLAYTPRQGAAPPPPVPVAQPIPAWAKATALLAPTIGGGMAAAGFGVSLAAPGLSALSSTLWAGAGFLAAVGICGAALVRAVRRRMTDAAAPTHITQHIEAHGLFGRAHGTINHVEGP
ncbi:hypothetical protein ACFU99_17655 [Streptomyces sp. NPDC057654]|uniref:hypothetical protein n=1 Tax=Streptomyces sp. NPDC057654 TaxID=3346196 RepID=UPI0036A5587E